MWIMLNDAFVSLVEDRNDPELLMARARRSGDLAKAFPGIVEVFTDYPADYPYRCSISKIEAAACVGAHVMGINYPNFKDSVKEPDRKLIYSEVWRTMLDLEDCREEPVVPWDDGWDDDDG